MHLPYKEPVIGGSCSDRRRTRTYSSYKPMLPRQPSRANFGTGRHLSTNREDRSNLFEQLRLGRGRITDDADIDVTSERRALHRCLSNTAKQHQEDSSLDLKSKDLHISAVFTKLEISWSWHRRALREAVARLLCRMYTLWGCY